MALILITHDLGLAREYGDDIIVMRAGHVVESGRVADVLTSPRHTYTRELLAAEPVLGGPSPRGDVPAESPGNASEPLVRATNLCKTFHSGGEVVALDHVSFRIEEGESVGIVGESGSGKTTLARCLVGLEQADGGTIVVSSNSHDTLPAAERPLGRRMLGTGRQRQSRSPAIQIVFQNPYSALNPARTIGKALEEALAVGGRSRDEVAPLLTMVGLPTEHARRFPVDLSGGERQRVAIARAIAPRPRLLVCDEAVSALDVSVQAQILDLIVDLQRTMGLPSLFITHDLAVARQVSDRLIVMRSGAIVEEGPTEELLRNPRHPYTKQLLDAVPGDDQ